MNYINVYKKLIRKAKCRNLGGYFEKHHIIPKCLGGKDCVKNIVKLTAREHYIAHLLLVKIFEKLKDERYYKLLWALKMMSVSNKFQNRVKLNNRIYGFLKKNLKHSKKTKDKISKAHIGKKLSKETKERISHTRKIRIANGNIEKSIGKNNGMYGKTLSEESRLKISLANKGKKDSEETKVKKSLATKGSNNPMYGSKMPDWHRNKISEVNKGRRQSKDHVYKRTKDNKGKIHINNGFVNKFVKKEEYFDKWIELGYAKGMKKRIKEK